MLSSDLSFNVFFLEYLNYDLKKLKILEEIKQFMNLGLFPKIIEDEKKYSII